MKKQIFECLSSYKLFIKQKMVVFYEMKLNKDCIFK
jgi:hypothetical protein